MLYQLAQVCICVWIFCVMFLWMCMIVLCLGPMSILLSSFFFQILDWNFQVICLDHSYFTKYFCILALPFPCIQRDNRLYFLSSCSSLMLASFFLCAIIILQKPFSPKKYFSIDRVFRNEAVDRTHLAEFHQIEGTWAIKLLGSVFIS